MPLQISFSPEQFRLGQSVLIAGLEFGLCVVLELGKV